MRCCSMIAYALLQHKDLQVVTNNLNVATLLIGKQDCRLILAGGEVRTKQAIIENSRCVMIVTYHSKFGRNAMVNLGNMDLIDYLFTDQLPPLSVMKIIEQHKVQLELC